MTPSHAHIEPRWPTGALESRYVKTGLALCCLSIFFAWRVAHIPYLGACALNAAALMQLWWPLWRQEHVGASIGELGLTRVNAKRALIEAALWASITSPMWLIASWYLLTGTSVVALIDAARSALQFYLETQGGGLLALRIIAAIASQLLGVALIEEIFWRGYVQPHLAHRIYSLGPLKLPWGTHLTTLLFALSHLLEDAQPMRLATYLPGLSFALLRSRHRSIVGSVALHAWDNLIAQALQTVAR